MRAIISLRSAGAGIFLAALAACATTAQPKKYGWGGQPSSGGGSGTVTQVTATAPLSVTNGTTTPALTIAAATTSAAGTMSSDDKTKLDGIVSGGWFDAEKIWLATVCPWVTEWTGIKAGLVPISRTASATSDPLVEGGAVGSSNAVVNFSTATFLAPKTGKVCVEFRARLNVPTTAKIDEIGIGNNAGNHSVWFGTWYDSPGNEHSKYILSISNGANTIVSSSLAVDGGWHNFALTFNGTTYTLYADHVSIATQTTLTNVADEGMGPFMFASAISDSAVAKIVYGTISP
jgi:hypothetical protein